MPVYRRCKVRIWIFLLSVWYVDQGIMAEMDLPSQDLEEYGVFCGYLSGRQSRALYTGDTGTDKTS